VVQREREQREKEELERAMREEMERLQREKKDKAPARSGSGVRGVRGTRASVRASAAARGGSRTGALFTRNQLRMSPTSGAKELNHPMRHVPPHPPYRIFIYLKNADIFTPRCARRLVHCYEGTKWVGGRALKNR
jgi:hypothetical protein